MSSGWAKRGDSAGSGSSNLGDGEGVFTRARRLGLSCGTGELVDCEGSNGEGWWTTSSSAIVSSSGRQAAGRFKLGRRPWGGG